jgi:hypothetical protein
MQNNPTIPGIMTSFSKSETSNPNRKKTMKTFSKTLLSCALMACCATAQASDMPDNVRVLVDKFTNGDSDAVVDQLIELGWCYDKLDETSPLNWRQCKTINANASCRTIRRVDEAVAPCAYIPKVIAKIDVRKSDYSGKKTIDFVGETKNGADSVLVEENPVLVHVLEWQYMATVDDFTIFKPKGLYQMGIVTTLQMSKYQRQLSRNDSDYKKLNGRSYTSLIHTYNIGCSARTAQLIEKSYFDDEGRLIVSVKQSEEPSSYLGLEEAARHSCGVDS